MKKIIILPVILIPLFSILAILNSNSSKIASNDIAQQILPDSLSILLKNTPMIYYSRGHDVHSWSLVARIDSSYRIYSGRTYYTGVQHYNNISDSTSFDTLKFINQNEALLSWGLDTMSVEAINMKKVHRTQYFPIYSDLSVFNPEGVNVFSSDDAVAFAGTDSIIFNTKFQRLCLIMWWLSDSRIRKYIPDSAIY